VGLRGGALAPALRRSPELAGSLVLISRAFEAPPVSAREIRSTTLEPDIEAGCVVHEQSREQLAAIQLDGSDVVVERASLLEQLDVAADRVGIEPHLLLTASEDYHVSEVAAKEAERLAERVSRVGIVELGPERTDDRVATGEAAVAIQREICKESEALGLREYRVQLGARRAGQFNYAEQS